MIYVMSDIHGHKKEFDSLLEQIQFSDEDTLYVLGDVVDKGPEPMAILKQIMATPNMKMLLGNHEHMMLGVLDFHGEDQYQLYRNETVWENNAGRYTKMKFEQETEADQQAIIQYLRSLPLNFTVKVGEQYYKLVHAAPIELFGKIHSRYHDPETFVVWQRLGPEDDIPFDKPVIFGHTPTVYYQDIEPMEIWHGDGWTGIDCGCAYDGRLACLRLDDMAEFYSASVTEG